MSQPSFIPNAIYVDTNPLLAAGWPTPSVQLLQVMSQAEKLGFPLCLPEVVIQELEGHWIRELVEEWNGANGQIGNLNKKARSVVRFDKMPALPGHDQLQSELRALVTDFNRRFRIVPTTQRPLAEFVNLAITRGATFKDEGRGFQDAVILCSVIDDMNANGFDVAFIVTHDGAFKSGGAAALAGAAGVVLKVVSTLDELEGLLREHFNAIVREYYDQERRELMEALKQRMSDLESYIVENLTVAPGDLQVAGTVKKIESLQVVSIENVHRGFFLEHEQPQNPNQVRVSADVKIVLSLDVERYSLPDSPRLKVGGVLMSRAEPGPNPFALLFEINAKAHEAVAVVEAEAVKTETGYSDLRFTATYLKRKDWGFGSLAGLFGGPK